MGGTACLGHFVWPFPGREGLADLDVDTTLCFLPVQSLFFNVLIALSDNGCFVSMTNMSAICLVDILEHWLYANLIQNVGMYIFFCWLSIVPITLSGDHDVTVTLAVVGVPVCSMILLSIKFRCRYTLTVVRCLTLLAQQVFKHN